MMAMDDEEQVLRSVARQTADSIRTARQRAEERKEAALWEQASLLNLTHDSIFVRDMNDVITYWNRGAEELYGWPAEKAVGQVSHELTRTVFPIPIHEIQAELLRAGRWEGELVHSKADGAQVIVASRWSLQRDEQQRPLAVLETNNDISERKRAEAELRESEQRYRYIFQSTGVSILEEDFSQVQAVIDDLKAQGVHDFPQYVAAHPEFVEQTASMVKIRDANDATLALFGAQNKQQLLDSVDRIFTPEAQPLLSGELIALAQGRSCFESQVSLRTLKGNRIAVLCTIRFPTEPAKLNSVLVSIMDLTEQKRAEESLRQAQAELAHVNRVTTMGELTASLAHEVNQPLSAVVASGHACLQWLSADPPDLFKVRQAAERIVRYGKDAGEVVRRVRALFKKTAEDKIALDLNEVIGEVLSLLRGDIARRRVVVETDLDRTLPPVIGDRIQLQQVLLNLLLNALEAMDSVVERSRMLSIGSARNGEEAVVVRIRDRGVGMQDPGKAFEAFFTTKENGMGMGLAICRSIIDAHNGRLWFASIEGPGATVCFTIPVFSSGMR
jgi:PAS domain S-box-containing protein